MEQAKDLIIHALQEAPRIQAAGRQSVLAIAAQALNPDTALSREGIAATLDLPGCLVIAILVTADLAGDTESRRTLGLTLFDRIELNSRLMEITANGQIALAIFCLRQLVPLDPELDQLVEQVIGLAESRLAGQEVDPLALKEAEQQALEVQRTKVVAVEKGAKSKLGLSPQENKRRRGAQAVRALVAGLRQPAPDDHLSVTVAGEVAGVVAVRGASVLDEGVPYCLALAQQIKGLPAEHGVRKPGNGGRPG